jgi:hypothetical protein
LKQKAERVSIDEGIQIDSSDEQFEKAASPRVRSRQPRSNVNVRRCPHSLKQLFESVSIDEGIQIDSSDEHFSNADSPRIDVLLPGLNPIDKTDLLPRKQPAQISSTSQQISTSVASPKYRTRQNRPTVTTKLSQTLKNG